MARPEYNPTTLLLQLLGLMLAAAMAVGLQARERASGSADVYGYSLGQSGAAGSCSYDYVALDRSASGLPLNTGHDAAAADDGAALLPLARPFELYQTPGESLVVSGNGYLAPATSLAGEDGSDFSNDCGLPALADNAAASQNRIYVYHDDLRPQPGGQVRQGYFAICPRTSGSGLPEACTVVEWDGFERAGPIPSTAPLRAQAVLYHGSHEIAMQYASVDDSRGAQATVGLQGFEGRAARQASCNRGDQVKSGQAICFYDPRHRPTAPLVASP